jgi:hypothetical protein
MAFINVSKVTLEDTSDGVEAFADVNLLLASITLDCIKENDFKLALHHLRGLRSSVDTLEYFLTKKLKEDNSKEAKNKTTD